MRCSSASLGGVSGSGAVRGASNPGSLYRWTPADCALILSSKPAVYADSAAAKGLKEGYSWLGGVA